MVVSTSTEQPLATIDKTTPIAGTTSYSNSTLHPQYISPGKSWPESQPFPVATPSGNKLSLNSSKCISDDCWSPFDNPSVQQCLAARLQPALSLLESRHQTPMYVPDQSSSFATRSRGPRDPSLVATTYAGYAQPMERITLSILDIESGEFLRQFPFR
ncbi:hypothetical protein GGI26_001626 [Coemansia sp. RSA 1358]|nr:hypothetical protein GGI26_001626 [Coemansia sp. RSA 1358]